MEPTTRSLYITCASADEARELARALLDRRLIACANVFPAGTSYYRWEGDMHADPEVVMICKTTDGRLEEAVRVAAELHPYDVPCVVALQAVAGNPSYLAWVEDETRPE